MYLTYFDEVKYDPPKQQGHILGGITLSIDDVPKVEEAVNQLSRDIFQTALLDCCTEFHGSHMFQGKGIFKGMTFEKRFDIFKSLIKILDQPEIIKKTFVQILPENIVATGKAPEDICFMYFVEQVDELLGTLKGKGVLFGDYDDPIIGTSVANLSHFKNWKTEWSEGREINCLVDTVYFSHSHHSRLIQLADIFVYCIQFWRSDNNESHYRKTFFEYLQNESSITKGCRAKIWPTERVWYRQ
jgi:hypothetical protein